MDELIKNCLAWLKTAPRWCRCVVPLLLATLMALWLCTSCGVTRTTVRTNGKGTTNASISVTTNNPTSVDVRTKVDTISMNINPKKK